MTNHEPLRILCVPGVGLHPPGGKWEQQWREAIGTSLGAVAPDVVMDIDFVHYADIFDDHEITFSGSMEAVTKLLAGGLGLRDPSSRGGLSSALRWTAGVVVQWVENEQLREQTRQRLHQRINDFDPHLVLAHSLGSLVSYDTFVAHPDAVNGRMFASFGSHIGNPFVVGQLGAGHVDTLNQARRWFHLHNQHDLAFTAPLYLSASNFTQIETPFGIVGILDHDSLEYLSHPQTRRMLWTYVVVQQIEPGINRSPPSPVAMPAGETQTASAASRNRALIVGINDYPDWIGPLRGCVNDAYLVSEVLQEMDIPIEEIRLCTNERATADNLREHLGWLLRDTQPGDVRFFYFSGHGAQIPGTGLNETVDRVDEALVTVDFDWSPEKSLLDDYFYSLYSQLPYETHFVGVLDCCHSGGMTRAGASRIRGINPPNDIRHQLMRWNGSKREWQPRVLAAPNPEVFDLMNPKSARARNRAQSTHRLGQAMPLRNLSRERFVAMRQAQQHSGPYMPLLAYACAEHELAQEHTFGATDHGVFTYWMVKVLRSRNRYADFTFEKWIKAVAEKLRAAGFEQHPQLVGPQAKQSLKLPFG